MSLTKQKKDEEFSFATLELTVKYDKNFEMSACEELIEKAREHGWPVKAELRIHKDQVIDLT